MSITIRTGSVGATYPNQGAASGTGFASALEKASSTQTEAKGPPPPTGGPEGFKEALKQAGIDPDQFKAAMDEARSQGVQPGSPEFNSILQSHGIDPSKMPQPPQGGREAGEGRRGNFDQILKDNGIDPAEFKSAMDEAREKGLKPGSDDFNAILQAHGIDPTAMSKLPMPHESGSQGNPSRDGRQFSLSSIDSSSLLDRALPDETKAQPVDDDQYV